MNYTFLLILRAMIAILAMVHVYAETGIATTIFIAISYSWIEYREYKTHQLGDVLDKIKQLENLIGIYRQTQKNSFFELHRMIETIEHKNNNVVINMKPDEKSSTRNI